MYIYIYIIYTFFLHIKLQNVAPAQRSWATYSGQDTGLGEKPGGGNKGEVSQCDQSCNLIQTSHY